jgi:hypothetical protein
MTIGLILKRMRREWRSLAILLLAVGLLTGFFALGPFYVRSVTEVGLRFELDNADSQDKLITLILEDEPLTPESYEVVREELGDLATGIRHYIRADYTPPSTAEGINNPGLATGGYYFMYGEVIDAYARRTQRTYQPFAFDNMPELLDLVEGRWPVRLPPPEDVDPTGLSDAEQEARQIGRYNRGQIEVVITQTVAEEAEMELGSRLVLGTILPDGSGEVASVVVVGIVEPKDANDPFWEGNRNFLVGSIVEMGVGAFRYDFGLATIPVAYTDWLVDVAPGSNYIYEIETNTDAITADNTQEVNERLKLLQNRLNNYHPGANLLSGLVPLLEGFSGDVSDTEGPIVLLSGAILLLLLYHLINTVSLVLEQQGAEWSTIVSRGGSVLQLVALQLVTVGLLAVTGMIAGPFISIGFMHILERFGPLATALGGRSLGSTDIPVISLYLSAGAAAATVIVLTTPAVPAARRSLLRLKQLVSRPPTRPAWARYTLDGVLLVIGLAFMVRMYHLAGGSFFYLFEGNIVDLLEHMVSAPRDVIEVIADNLTETGGLHDPFNLLGPALVLTGAALLWLRLFPWAMDLVSRLFRGSRHLTTPLAMWNVARDPGHYAQLVLLLIGTLALGTASLGLTETRDQGAWKVARDETGGSARVDINPVALDADTVNWDRMPGVSVSLPLLHVAGDPGRATRGYVHVIGLDPDAAAAAFPELAETVEPLRAVAVPTDPGLTLPDDARHLTVQVYSLPPAVEDDPLVSVQLTAYLNDALGVPYSVPLLLPDRALMADAPQADMLESGLLPTRTDEWLTFSGEMPTQGRLPYRLVRIGINSRQSNIEAFEHTLYIDRIASQDVFGTSQTLESFEDEANVWAEATVSNPYAASWAVQGGESARVRGVTPQVVSGEVPDIEGPGALRLDYRTGRQGGRQLEPSIVVNEPQVDRLPVVISRRFANEFAGQGPYRSAADEPLVPGNIKNIVLNMGPGSVEIGYEVVGLMDEIPSLGEDEMVMITHIDLIRPVINQAAAANMFFDNNEVWLELPDRQPTGALKDEIRAIDGVNTVNWAWTRYGEIQREPLPSAVAGMLFAGFWVSLGLSLLDFAFYLVVTAKQRAFTFGVLRSLGWNASHIWRLLLIEQVVLVTPALIIGSLLGAGLAYLLLPFLALVGGESLRLPWLNLAGMLLVLAASFMVLMGIAAVFLRRMSVNQVLRLGEE